MTRNMLLLIGAILILAPLAAACGGGADAGSSANSDELDASDWNEVHLYSVNATLSYPPSWDLEEIGTRWQLHPPGEEGTEGILNIRFVGTPEGVSPCRKEADPESFTQCALDTYRQRGATANVYSLDGFSDVWILEVDRPDPEDSSLQAIRQVTTRSGDLSLATLQVFGSESKVEEYRETILRMAETLTQG